MKPGVSVITPNPKTSGGAQWNYLAAWEYAQAQVRQATTRRSEFVTRLYKNVPVLDSGARGSTTTFVERGVGDVLLAWENEAFLALQGVRRRQVRDRRAVAVDPRRAAGRASSTRTSTSKGTRKAAEAYLQYLYSEEGQEIAARNFYRPTDPKVAAKYAKPVPEADAGHDRRRVRRLAQRDEDALRRRRHVRPDLPARGAMTARNALAMRMRASASPSGRNARDRDRRARFDADGAATCAAQRHRARDAARAARLRPEPRHHDRLSRPDRADPAVGRVHQDGGADLARVRRASSRRRASWRAIGSRSARRSRAALVNTVFGLLVAWVLVRYRFPGRRLVDALVDLPFALPTAVAGIALDRTVRRQRLVRRRCSRRSASRSRSRRSACSSR